MKLQRGEKILYQGAPERKILILWFLDSLIYTFAFSLIIFLYILGESADAFLDFFEFVFSYLSVFLTVLIIVFSYRIILRKTYKYYITTKNVIFEGGFFFKRIKIVPYHKITNVSVSQNIFERMIGLSRINIQTAGTGMRKPELQFVGLSNPEKPLSIIMERIEHLNAYSKE